MNISIFLKQSWAYITNRRSNNDQREQESIFNVSDTPDLAQLRNAPGSVSKSESASCQTSDNVNRVTNN